MEKVEHRQLLIAELPINSVGAEIGVHKGDFSKVLMDSLSLKELHLIDPWAHEEGESYKTSWYGGLAKDGQREMDKRYQQVLKKFRKEIDLGNILVHRKPSLEALNSFNDEYFDWIYIDGNHLYEYVLTDLKESYNKVKRGGFIVGDDYGPGGWWNGGVMKAVNQFTEEYSINELKIFGNQFLIQKK